MRERHRERERNTERNTETGRHRGIESTGNLPGSNFEGNRLLVTESVDIGFTA